MECWERVLAPGHEWLWHCREIASLYLRKAIAIHQQKCVCRMVEPPGSPLAFVNDIFLTTKDHQTLLQPSI